MGQKDAIDSACQHDRTQIVAGLHLNQQGVQGGHHGRGKEVDRRIIEANHEHAAMLAELQQG